MEDVTTQNIEKHTGISVTKWIDIALKSGKDKHGELVNYLKTEHALTHGYANYIALKTFKTDAGSIAETEDLVELMLQGKDTLRPIYDMLTEAIASFGEDVEFAHKKGYTSVRRKKQFALLQPSTKDRFDVGINLKGTEPNGRLEKSGSWSAMVSHRVRITTTEQADDELLEWLREAYHQAG